MKTFFLFFSLYVCLFSCNKTENPAKNRHVDGMKPIYTQLIPENIFSDEPTSPTLLQNFILFRKYILVVEHIKGIHVIDNNDPSNPISIAFWHIPGIRNFTITNNTLYVPIVDKLVSIDVTDIDNISLIGITEGLFQNVDNNLFPDNYEGSFACVDPSKGIVIGWEMDSLFNPQCWR